MRDMETQGLPHSPAAPPAEFGQYVRGSEIGRGASAQVFECRRSGEAEHFAVKVLHLRGMKLSQHGERDKQRLERELAILRSLPPHRRIVRMVDSVEEGNWFFLVLELVPGGDMYGALVSHTLQRARPRLLEREAFFVFQQLIEALDFLHQQGVIHRDLKLENVLIASRRREGPHTLFSVKISDFGLSKSIGIGLAHHSSVGTMRYAAPEVLEGKPYDFRADLWSLGVLLYVMLQGSFPHDQPQRLTQEALDGIVDQADASSSARSVVRGLLQLDPARRSSLQDLQTMSWDGSASSPVEQLSCEQAASDTRHPDRPMIIRDSSSEWGTQSLFGSEELPVAPPAPGATPSAIESALSVPALSCLRRSHSRGMLNKQGSSLLPFADAVLAMAEEEEWFEDGSTPGEGPPIAKRRRSEEGDALANGEAAAAEAVAPADPPTVV